MSNHRKPWHTFALSFLSMWWETDSGKGAAPHSMSLMEVRSYLSRSGRFEIPRSRGGTMDKSVTWARMWRCQLPNNSFTSAPPWWSFELLWGLTWKLRLDFAPLGSWVWFKFNLTYLKLLPLKLHASFQCKSLVGLKRKLRSWHLCLIEHLSSFRAYGRANTI